MGWFRNDAPSDDEGSGPRTLEERLAAIEPGVPGHCPACDGLGYIDDLDLGQRYQIQHCKACGHRWEYLFDGDGRVVGLTELDQGGRPVARMRVRRPLVADRMEAPPAPVLPPLPDPAPPTSELGTEGDEVIDLRADAPAGADDDDVVDLREPAPAEPATVEHTHLTPAEWLRHSLRR